MAVYQTECYRVVTIGYLKSFIGSNIQNSAGAVVYVNTTQPDTYCPTYGELTGGSLIPNWAQGSTPNGDRDGITVRLNAVLGGTYASNQCVDQRDLGLMYTRFSGLTISLGKTGFSACEDSTSVSYTHNYIRYNTFMNDSCDVSTTSTTVGDTTCGELTWHPSLGSVTNCNTYSIPKNSSSTGEAPARTGSVYSSVVFRTATKNSNTVNISQAALTGSWLDNGTSYGIGAWPSTSQSFGCDGGSYGAYGTGYTYKTYVWKDACGATYPSRTSGTTATTSLGSQSGSFSAWDCCDGAHSESASLSFSYQGLSTSVSFAMSCADCSDSSSCVIEPDESFWPWYPDSEVPASQKFPRGIRGTDNGGCYAMCVNKKTGEKGEQYFVAPYVPSSNLPEENEDAILVDTIYVYVNGVRTNLRNTSGRINVTPDVDIEYVGGSGSFGKGQFNFYIKTTNTTNDFKSLIINFSTDDTEFPSFPGTNYAPYAGTPVAHDWEFIIWQPPANCNVVETYPDTGSESHSGWAHCG